MIAPDRWLDRLALGTEHRALQQRRRAVAAARAEHRRRTTELGCRDPAARAGFDLRHLEVDLPGVAHRYEGLVLRSGDDGDLTVEITIPHGDGPFPVLISTHGGGWCIGSPRSVRRPTTKIEPPSTSMAGIRRTSSSAGTRLAGDLVEVGRLFDAGHASLRDDVEVTGPEPDTLVGPAREAGATAARMTGGGFGGAIIVLSPVRRADEIADEIVDRYASVHARRVATAHLCRAADGARQLACVISRLSFEHTAWEGVDG